MNPYYSNSNSDRLGSPYNKFEQTCKQKINRDRIGSLRNNINVHDANNEVYSFFALKGKCRS